uniref:ALS2 C-terminal like n=1 Tax=Paramormyrops kingsleyae TaxID=1676925 RepID=A0A3B3Q3U3_9TELE|nr:ALS2 C-terminal-like protein isoform X1 [Paramormyrops kingsleyae]XP_023663231.1 ALS2 C-terminal-like protein isoform X1 [Paramormyrops kingsleyae]
MSLVQMKDKWIKVGQDLVKTDKAFLEYLSDVNVTVLQHLLNHNAVEGKRQMQMTQLLQLSEKFQALWDYTEVKCKQLQTLTGQGNVQSSRDVYIIEQMESIQQLYTEYFSSFTNFVVVGGFDYIGKKTSTYWKENKVNLWRFINAQKCESSVSLNLYRILHERLREQISHYTRILTLLTEDDRQIVGDEGLDGSLRGFMDLKSYISQVLDEATLTKDLWKSLGQKLTDILCTPERRLQEDSKNAPISLSAGRFGHDRILLCNDALIHLQGSDVRYYDLSTLWIEPIDMDISESKSLKVITPEDQLIFHTLEPHNRVMWYWKLNQAVRQCLAKKRDFPLWGKGNKGQRPANPPNCRFTTYTFKNEGRLKNAIYEGDWKQGKPHGKGTLKWEDERNYTGDFINGLEHGFGVYLVSQAEGYNCYKCHWIEGKKQRYGMCEYSTNTIYRGYFKGDLRHGFGILESNRGESSLIRYVGHWENDRKHGYGIMETADSGDRYIGMWKDDQRDGRGIMVTQSGLCYEGNFQGGKLIGKGVLLSEDNSLYEGEFTEDLQLRGKGKMTFPDGITIEGTFSSTFGNGLQANGVMNTSNNTEMSYAATHLQLGQDFLVLGQWPGVFTPFIEYLRSDCTEKMEEAFLGFHTESSRSLRKVGSEGLGGDSQSDEHHSCSRREAVTNAEFLKELRLQQSKDQLQQYLEKSLQSLRHPLGKLLQTQTLVFQAAYSGPGANKHLLEMAQKEVKYHAEKIQEIIMDYVPQLFNKSSEPVESSETEMDFCSLVLPVILPEFYPDLSMLYMLYHAEDNACYRQGILHLNLLSDTKLMEFLDVQRHLWPLKDLHLTSNQRYSLVHDQCFLSAIECVQKISTTADPQEKLDNLFHTVDEIERTVNRILCREYKLPLDDLLPLLIYVISRARIQHLGSELHFIRDMMTPQMQGGMVDFLLTAFESCYEHMQKEEIRQGRFTNFT